MLEDFFIPRLSNDMKIADQKNHLGGQILSTSLDPSKKTASFQLFRRFFLDTFRCLSGGQRGWAANLAARRTFALWQVGRLRVGRTPHTQIP